MLCFGVSAGVAVWTQVRAPAQVSITSRELKASRYMVLPLPRGRCRNCSTLPRELGVAMGVERRLHRREGWFLARAKTAMATLNLLSLFDLCHRPPGNSFYSNVLYRPREIPHRPRARPKKKDAGSEQRAQVIYSTAFPKPAPRQQLPVSKPSPRPGYPISVHCASSASRRK